MLHRSQKTFLKAEIDKKNNVTDKVPFMQNSSTTHQFRLMTFKTKIFVLKIALVCGMLF